MDALKSTLAHVLELAVCFLVAWGVLAIFHVDNGTRDLVLGFVLNALAKFVRSHDGIPIGDYVNQ